jgi:predicted transcriptional regulator
MKQLNIRVDDDLYAELEQRAEGAHMTPADYARALLADDISEQRTRFLAYAAHFSKQWAPAFEAEFGPYPAKKNRQGDAA